jgi:hypothetical protein
MDCIEVQARLSDYLEKSLDGVTLREVESHLSHCVSCRNEADTLAECIQQVAKLPLVDPPPGFTHRVMARVRELESPPPLWQRWLLPLRFKLPLHATAVVLIAVLGVYLYQRESTQTPSQAKLESNARLKTKDAPSKIAASKTRPPTSVQTKTKLPRETEQGKESTRPAEEPKVTGEIAAARQTELSVIERPALKQVETQAEKKVESGAVLAPPPPPVKGLSVSDEVNKENRSSVPKLRGGPTAEPFSPERKTAPATQSRVVIGAPASSPPVEIDFVVRRHPTEHDSQTKARLDAQKKSAEMLPLHFESFNYGYDRLRINRVLPKISPTRESQTLWLTVPAAQYEQLKKELAELGTIESESPPPSRERAGLISRDASLRVKITIEPFAEPERAPPAKPGER